MKASHKLFITLLLFGTYLFGQSDVKPHLITDSTFIVFRNKLSIALKNKEVDAFMLLVSDTIATDLCGMHSEKNACTII